MAVSDLTEDERVAAARAARIGAGEVTVEVGNSQYDKAEASFQVGLDSVPPLKQVWIVDNSGTMVTNNINLANSFGSMFSQTNKDSLYKFETTSYLLSTAQTIPSYKSSSRSSVEEVANLQNDFLTRGILSESDFISQYRALDLNSGKIPGDNVGIQVRRSASSSTDFAISSAPVLGYSLANGFRLEKAVNKPANIDTAQFEDEFKRRLSVLQYQRVPKIQSVVNGITVEDAQSAKILDKESGLCGLARVLDNPQGMFSNGDLLAVTIVTDENENDVAGLNCLKRTAYLRGSENYVSGKCVEYRTPISIQTRSRDAKTCTLSGESSYQAAFPYSYPYAMVSYYQQKSAEVTTSTTPQTKISWKTPTSYNQYEQYQTKAVYYTWKSVPAVYEYYLRQITVKYYTNVCTQINSDGTSTLKCVASSSPTSKVIDGTSYSTCTAAAKALNSNAVIATSAYISADKLPDCSLPTAEKLVSSCATADTVNCRSVLKSAATVALDQGPLSVALVGDRTADCDAALLSKSASAIISSNTNFGSTYKPVCSAPQWQIISSGGCSASSTCRITSVSSTPADGSATVLGKISEGTSACTAHSSVPSNAIAGSVHCTSATAKVTYAACTSSELAAGCTSVITPAVLAYTTSTRIDGLKSAADCNSWVSAKSDNRTDASHPLSCDLKSEARAAYATRTFPQVGTSALNKGDLCGSTATTFYSALSSADKSLVPSSEAINCKINSVLAGAAQVRTLAAGGTCLAQKEADCSALGYRNCTTTDSGGGFTAAYSSWSSFSAIRAKGVTCSSLCNSLPAGSCETWSNQGITLSQYLTNKFGVDIQVNCKADSSVEVSPAISTITSRPVTEQSSFCSASDSGDPRYFVATTTPAPLEQYVDEYVAGNSDDGASPRMDLIGYIKNKIEEKNLNLNLTVFIRRSQDPDGAGTGINYKGVDYERLTQVLTAPSVLNGQPLATAQVFSVLDSSYEQALTNLSSVLKGKLIRSFTISSLLDRQVVTGVKILSQQTGEKNLTLGQWNQSGQVVNIDKAIAINEGDQIIMQYQNDDGYVYAQLKKTFIVDQMRADQIVRSIEQIKPSGLVIQLTPDQWVKDGQRVTIIDTTVILEAGDRFRIQFQNDLDEN